MGLGLIVDGIGTLHEVGDEIVVPDTELVVVVRVEGELERFFRDLEGVDEGGILVVPLVLPLKEAFHGDLVQLVVDRHAAGAQGVVAHVM